MGDTSMIFLLLAVLVAVLKPFTTLIHELGHAIPAMLMTKEKVTIYVGSYGDNKKGLTFNVGLLDVCLRYNFLSWHTGLCMHSVKQISVNKQVLIVLAGPIASTVIALTASYFSFACDLHGAVKLVLIVFLSCALFDLVVNLVPSSTPIPLLDGRVAYNDGYRLKQLFSSKILPNEYDAAVDAYNKGDYAEASKLFGGMLTQGLNDEQAFRLTITCYLQTGEYTAAKELTEKFSSLYKLDSNDYGNAGLACSQIGLLEEGNVYYEKSLQLDPLNKYTLNNMGYTLNLLGKHQEAILLFDRAIEVDDSLAYPYNNRGLAKIRCGMEDEGLADIKRSFELDADNAYSYRNLGIYHLDRKECSQALKLFEKAKRIDSKTHMIEDLIMQAELNMKTN